MTKDAFEQDNEQLSFITIGLAVRNVMSYLEPRKEKQPDGEAEQAPDGETDRKREHERAVEVGVRRIERFEMRYRRDATRR